MKVISFNSYKGGACRTTTCYNTLPYLAKKLNATSKQPILVVDSDLDSMGLTSIFHADRADRRRDERLPYSAKHLFVEDSSGINSKLFAERLSGRGIPENSWYFDNFEKVGNDLGLEDDGSVLFLGVDENESSISDDEFRNSPYSNTPPAARLISILSGFVAPEEQPRAIIFDCASGVQQTTLAVFMKTQISVMCMRPTYQFRIGTRNYLYRMLPAQIGNAMRREKRKVVLLPTSVASPVKIDEDAPNRQAAIDEFDSLRKRSCRAIQRDIVNFINNRAEEENLGYTLIQDMTEPECFGLPEIERFKWEECLLYDKPSLTEQEELLKERYAMLADILAEV